MFLVKRTDKRSLIARVYGKNDIQGDWKVLEDLERSECFFKAVQM